jgi:TonB family protein
MPSGDGGAGSGRKSPAPPRPAERPGRDAIAVPTPSSASARVVESPRPDRPIDIPALPTTAGMRDLPGVPAPLTPATIVSEGPGNGGNPGSGDGGAIGSGIGDAGFGPGRNDGVGDGYLPGGNVSAPRLIREVKPGYTGDAMRARIQGVVRLQAIVMPDGSVGKTRIIRSLDRTFGLDDEAQKTARQWRFQPGQLAGHPVPVLVEIELAFTLH